MNRVEKAILMAFVNKSDRISIDVIPLDRIIQRATRKLGGKVRITAKDVRQVLGSYDIRSSRMPQELKRLHGARCITTSKRKYEEILSDLEG